MTTDCLTIKQTPKSWNWRGHNITYQQTGETGAAVVLVHGFGASWGHWRKNLPVLGETCCCYAIDLIGFGGSDKPQPNTEIAYTFETWGQQLADFCREVVGSPAFLIGNSFGCIANRMNISYTCTYQIELLPNPCRVGVNNLTN